MSDAQVRVVGVETGFPPQSGDSGEPSDTLDKLLKFWLGSSLGSSCGEVVLYGE